MVFKLRQSVIRLVIVNRGVTTRPMALLSRQFSTPLGEMLAVTSPQGLCLLEFVGQGGVERELAQVEAAHGGPVQPGDHLDGWIEGVGALSFDIGPAE